MAALKTKPFLKVLNKNWGVLLSMDAKEHEIEIFRKHERTGRPLGEDSFIETMGLILGRDLKVETIDSPSTSGGTSIS